jgi:NADH:ubiquinone oxidoreductase subunit F (NADH-binding)
LAIAAAAVGAREAFIALKASFTAEIEAVRRALEEMASAGLIGDVAITLVTGPEEYLFGEEKALLEVIEGNDPMPRWLPPYLHGLFATTPQAGWSAATAPNPADAERTGSNPTLVNNVETLAHIPIILTRGAQWYRGIGTQQTPGPLLCTVVGDVTRPGYAEIEPGTSLRALIDSIGGGTKAGRAVKAVLCGVSSAALRGDELDVPVSYEGLEAAGSALGSAGFVVYDDTRSMLTVARMVSRFLYVESCGQCRACKFGCGEVTRHLDKLARGAGEEHDVKVIGQHLIDVTDQNRCFLGAQEQIVVSSLLRKFPEDFAGVLDDGLAREELPVPKLVELRDGVAFYDEDQARKQPDWTYAPT